MAAAQTARDTTHRLPRSLTVRVDNDAFDFWQPPWDRPDQDYTSGVRIVVDNAWRPWWAGRLWTRAPHCAGNALPCVSSTAWIGQDMYTAERDSSEKQLTVGARPNAGWLYFGEEYRRVDAARADLVGVTLGVTGPPSLAQYTQRLAHAVAPAFNAPIDWSHQLAFEPGVILSYEHDERLTLATAGMTSFELIPSATATAGNVLTQATARLEARMGYALRNPWLPPTARGPAEFAITVSLAGNAVARDLFLDGNTFRRDAHVGHEPFYAEQAYGVSLRVGALAVGYRMQFDQRTYATGRSHAWSSLIAGLAFDR